MEHRLSAPQIVISTIIEISRNFIIQKHSQIVVVRLKTGCGSFIPVIQFRHESRNETDQSIWPFIVAYSHYAMD